MELAAEEARRCIESKSGYYFRTFVKRPKELRVGSRIFYVEDGFIRGFGTVGEIRDSADMQCNTSGHDWGVWGDGRTHAIMHADSWKWIKPIPMKGFQGWRYFTAKNIKIVGDWLDPKPATK